MVDDLHLGRKEIAAYMEAQGISATEEELESVCVNSQGNAYTVHHTVLKMQEGMHPGQKLAEEVRRDFAAYLDIAHPRKDGGGERRCAGDRLCRCRTAGAV